MPLAQDALKVQMRATKDTVLTADMGLSLKEVSQTDYVCKRLYQVHFYRQMVAHAIFRLISYNDLKVKVIDVTMGGSKHSSVMLINRNIRDHRLSEQ